MVEPMPPERGRLPSNLQERLARLATETAQVGRALESASSPSSSAVRRKRSASTEKSEGARWRAEPVTGPPPPFRSALDAELSAPARPPLEPEAQPLPGAPYRSRALDASELSAPARPPLEPETLHIGSRPSSRRGSGSLDVPTLDLGVDAPAAPRRVERERGAQPPGPAAREEPREAPRAAPAGAPGDGGTPLGRLARRVEAFTGVLERLHLEHESPVPEAGGLAGTGPEMRAQLGDVIAQRKALEQSIRALQAPGRPPPRSVAEATASPGRFAPARRDARGSPSPRAKRSPRPLGPSSPEQITPAPAPARRAPTPAATPSARPEAQSGARQLAAVTADRDRLAVLLRCSQDALAKLSSENVALAEELARCSAASSAPRGPESSELREELRLRERELQKCRALLRQRTQAANKTILEMAQKNYELQGGKGSLRLEMPSGAASGLSPERPSPGRGASPRQFSSSRGAVRSVERSGRAVRSVRSGGSTPAWYEARHARADSPGRGYGTPAQRLWLDHSPGPSESRGAKQGREQYLEDRLRSVTAEVQAQRAHALSREHL